LHAQPGAFLFRGLLTQSGEATLPEVTRDQLDEQGEIIRTEENVSGRKALFSHRLYRQLSEPRNKENDMLNHDQRERLSLLGLDERERSIVARWRDGIEYVHYQLRIRTWDLLTVDTINWLMAYLHEVKREVVAIASDDIALGKVAKQLSTPLDTILTSFASAAQAIAQENQQAMSTALQEAARHLDELLPRIPGIPAYEDLQHFLGTIEGRESDLREVDTLVGAIQNILGRDPLSATSLQQARILLNQVREACSFIGMQIDETRYLYAPFTDLELRFARGIYGIIDLTRVLLPLVDASYASPCISCHVQEPRASEKAQLARIHTLMQSLSDHCTDLASQLDTLLT
jgi:hypothetical protein